VFRAGVPEDRHPEPMHSINWTAILLAIMVLVVLVRSGPGLRALLERSRQAQERDWTGFLIPIAVVVLFVLLLIKLVRP
jgi:succinate dehydrogenase hydrophobic anchor subunit